MTVRKTGFGSISPQQWVAFFGLTLLLLLSQMVGQDGTVVLEHLLGSANDVYGTWMAGLSFVSLCIVIFVGFMLTKSDPRPGMYKQIVLGLLSLVALILSNVVPEWVVTAAGLQSCSAGCHIAFSLAILVSWFVLYVWFLPMVQQWFQAVIDMSASRNPTVPDGPVTLIAIVSRITPEELVVGSSPSAGSLTRGRGESKNTYSLAFQSLDQDIEALTASKWPWQQLLRSIKRYAPRTGLKIVLVGSGPDAEGEGSFSQLALCTEFLRRYPELASATITALPNAVDFEDFNDVRDKVRARIREESRRVAEGNVFVDITGGQKMASAAAAAATTGALGQFQYVQTNSPYDVLVSDLHPPIVPAASS